MPATIELMPGQIVLWTAEGSECEGRVLVVVNGIAKVRVYLGPYGTRDREWTVPVRELRVKP